MFYHLTDTKNRQSILEKGILHGKQGAARPVYLARREEDAFNLCPLMNDYYTLYELARRCYYEGKPSHPFLVDFVEQEVKVTLFEVEEDFKNYVIYERENHKKGWAGFGNDENILEYVVDVVKPEQIKGYKEYSFTLMSFEKSTVQKVEERVRAAEEMMKQGMSDEKIIARILPRFPEMFTPINKNQFIAV